MAPLRPPGSTGCQINFQGRVGEYHGAHVATIGHQARKPAKTVLQINESQANLGQGTVYRYVRSKRELLDHVFDFAISKAARALNIGSLVSLDLTDYEESVKVSTMFGHRLFALVDEDPAIIRLITVQSSGIDPELRYRVVSLISTLHAAIAQLFQKANPDKTSDDDRKTWDLLARMVMGMAAPGFVMSIEQTASEERRERYMATAAAITDRGLLARVPETGVPAKEPG